MVSLQAMAATLKTVVNFVYDDNPNELHRNNMLSGRFVVEDVKQYVLCSSTYASDAAQVNHLQLAWFLGI